MRAEAKAKMETAMVVIRSVTFRPSGEIKFQQSEWIIKNILAVLLCESL
jgi:hypothetical protein